MGVGRWNVLGVPTGPRLAQRQGLGTVPHIVFLYIEAAVGGDQGVGGGGG